MKRATGNSGWAAFGFILSALCLPTVVLAQTQELPARLQSYTLVTPVPEGYEFPIEFSEAIPWKVGEELRGVVVQLRSRVLPKQFSVNEIVVVNARVNGQPVEVDLRSPAFSTGTKQPVQIDPLYLPLPAGIVLAAQQEDAGGILFEADAYVLISPTVLEMVRLGATQAVLRFPVSVNIPLGQIVTSMNARELAEYYSPVVVQETNDKRKDFLAKFNFDGNWNGNDNQENLVRFPLKGYVYYSVVESRSHFFLGYFFFHPADYVKLSGPACGFWNKVGAHENDLEGIQLVVEKDGTRYGSLLLMETLAHNFFYQLENSDKIKDKREVKGVLEDIDGHIELEIDETGQHPKVYIECLGHGVWGYGQSGKEVGGKDTYVVYRLGKEAEEPESKNDHDVRYELIDVFDPEEGLWAHREKLGDAQPVRTYMAPGSFWDGFSYRRRLGAAFFGDGGVHARPPWGWKAKGSERGDWFLAPAFAFSRHLFIPGLEGDALTYVHNPYLEEGGRNPEQPPEEEAAQVSMQSDRAAAAGETKVLAPGDNAVVADVTRLLMDDRLSLDNLSTLTGALKTGQDVLLPLASQYVRLSGEDASRISIRYKNVFGLKSVRLYWKTEQMEDFDEEHSVRLHLSSKTGWHWQTVELLELESFDKLATIDRFKVSLELDKEVFSWSGTATDLYQMVQDLPKAVEVFFGRSEYLEEEKTIAAEEGSSPVEQ